MRKIQPITELYGKEAGDDELFYVADSFSDYIMTVLRGHIVRPRKVKKPKNPDYPRWVNNIGPQLLIEEIHLDWGDWDNDTIVANDNNAAPTA